MNGRRRARVVSELYCRLFAAMKDDDEIMFDDLWTRTRVTESSRRGDVFRAYAALSSRFEMRRMVGAMPVEADQSRVEKRLLADRRFFVARIDREMLRTTMLSLFGSPADVSRYRWQRRDYEQRAFATLAIAVICADAASRAIGPAEREVVRRALERRAWRQTGWRGFLIGVRIGSREGMADIRLDRYAPDTSGTG